jgi:hypothetical protein
MQTKNPSLGDRFAEITVVVVTVIALLVGWMFKSSVENRSVPFTSGAVSAALPTGWLESEGKDGDLVRVTDMSSSGFATTYKVKYAEVSKDVTYDQFASAETRGLGQNLIAFRVLNQQQVTVNGKEAFEISYVFVESNPNAARQELPVVVRGLEYIFIKDGKAVTVTYWASQSEYDAGLNLFKRFLTSVKY